MATTRTALGERFSEGARLMWLALRAREWTASDLRARMVGREGGPLKGGVVEPILYGDRLPSIPMAAQIERLLDVPPKAFDKPPTRAFALTPGGHAAKMPTQRAARKVAKGTGDRRSAGAR